MALAKEAVEAMNRSVLQDWVHGLSFMQQTVLMTAVRGPDGMPKYGPVKMLQRWYRRCILLSAIDGGVLTNPYDPRGGSFTGPSILEPDPGYRDQAWQCAMDTIVGEYLRLVDCLPHHYQLHFMHASEIVGYKHPDTRIREWWHGVYNRLVHDMHLRPEIEEIMDERLGDSREDWLKHGDPATSN